MHTPLRHALVHRREFIAELPRTPASRRRGAPDFTDPTQHVRTVWAAVDQPIPVPGHHGARLRAGHAVRAVDEVEVAGSPSDADPAQGNRSDGSPPHRGDRRSVALNYRPANLLRLNFGQTGHIGNPLAYRAVWFSRLGQRHAAPPRRWFPAAAISMRAARGQSARCQLPVRDGRPTPSTGRRPQIRRPGLVRYFAKLSRAPRSAYSALDESRAEVRGHEQECQVEQLAGVFYYPGPRRPDGQPLLEQKSWVFEHGLPHRARALSSHRCGQLRTVVTARLDWRACPRRSVIRHGRAG